MADSFDVNLTIGSAVGYKQVGGKIIGGAPRIETVKGADSATTSTAVGWTTDVRILYVDPLQTFDTRLNSTSTSQLVRMTNFGNATLTVTNVLFVDSEAVQYVTTYNSATNITIPAGNTATFILSYYGKEVGEYTSLFAVFSNNSAGPYRVITKQTVNDSFGYTIDPIESFKTVDVYGRIQREEIVITPAGGIVEEITATPSGAGFHVRNLTTGSFSFEFDPDDVNNINGIYTGTVAILANTVPSYVGTVTAVTATIGQPVLMTVPNHNLDTGTRILVENVQGMTDLNGKYYWIDRVTSSTIWLYNSYANNILFDAIDGTGFGVYTGGGVVYERGGTTEYSTMTVEISLGTFEGYNPRGRSQYENWKSYGAWMSSGTYYNSVVAVSYDRIGGRKHITIGMGTTGTYTSTEFVSGGNNLIDISGVGLGGGEAMPPYPFWDTVFLIPLNEDGDTTPRTYYSGNYKVKEGHVNYADYFGEFRAQGSPFIVRDDGKNTVVVELNHLRELSGDDRIDTTLENLTRSFHYYQGHQQPDSEFTGNIDPLPMNSTEDYVADGNFTKLFNGFYLNTSRFNTATTMTSIVSLPL